MNFLDLVKRTIRESGSHLEAPDSVEEATGLQERFVQWVRDAWAELQVERSDWFFRQEETRVPIDPLEIDDNVIVLPANLADEFEKNWRLITLRDVWLSELDVEQEEEEAVVRDAFIMTISTFLSDPGDPNPRSFKVPAFAPELDYDFTVDWGDGVIQTNQTNTVVHTYEEDGEYQITITGKLPHMDLYTRESLNAYNTKKLVSIDQWGTIEWESFSRSFRGAINMQIKATDAPDLSRVTNMGSMFEDCTTLNAELNWDTSNVTDMRAMFRGATSFNSDIKFDTSNVTEMRFMFAEASSFNRPINFDTRSVIRMDGMFRNASSFNRPLNFDTSNVTNMDGVFEGATVFNQPLPWDVSSAESMESMFLNAETFNQNLSEWCVELIPSRPDGFDDGATSWVLPRPNWGHCGPPDISGDFVFVVNTDASSYDSSRDQYKIYTNSEMTYNYTVDWGDGVVDTGITGDITHTFPSEGIYTIRIRGEFPHMFMNNAFPQTDATKVLSVEQWGDIQWENMSSMFYGASNMELNATDSPDLSNVTNMSKMFQGATSLNQPLDWDTSSVTDMNDMFWGATSFNQDLSAWCVSSFAIQPAGFANNTPNWVLPKPNWGAPCGS